MSVNAERHGMPVAVTLIVADRPCRECRAAKKSLAALAAALAGRVAVRELPRSHPEAQALGVLLTPVVLVAGRVFSMGRRPPEGQLAALLREECGG